MNSTSNLKENISMLEKQCAETSSWILSRISNYEVCSCFPNVQKLIFEIVAIRVVLRGKAHAEWKVMLSGDRRTVKGDQYFLDQRQTIWGEKNLNSTIPILPRGVHKFPFK